MRSITARADLYPFINKTSPLNIKWKIRLYKTMIRSIMIYATPIWSQAPKTRIKKLEVVERNTLRIIMNKSTMETTNEEL